MSVSFHEVSIAIRAENYASASLRALALDVANLGGYFGLLSDDMIKAVSVAFTLHRTVKTLATVIKLASAAQAAHNTATQVGVLWTATNATATNASSISQKLHAVASWIATAAQNALNISYGTFLVLTGVGIGLVIAAAAAMAIFASQMNAATDSMKSYNAAASEMPTHYRSIRRAGEERIVQVGSSPSEDEEEMYRKGVEY